MLAEVFAGPRVTAGNLSLLPYPWYIVLVNIVNNIVNYKRSSVGSTGERFWLMTGVEGLRFVVVGRLRATNPVRVT